MARVPIWTSVPPPRCVGSARSTCLVHVGMCGLSDGICKTPQKLLGLGELGTGNGPVV